MLGVNDPATISLTLSQVLSIVGVVISTLGGVAIFFMRHSFETEKKLMVLGIDTSNQQSDRAMTKVGELNEKLHETEKALLKLEGLMNAAISEVRRLDAKDDAQGNEIREVQRRIDRGARTYSAQMPAREEPSEPPPYRPKLPSRGGG